MRGRGKQLLFLFLIVITTLCLSLLIIENKEFTNEDNNAAKIIRLEMSIPAVKIQVIKSILPREEISVKKMISAGKKMSGEKKNISAEMKISTLKKIPTEKKISAEGKKPAELSLEELIKILANRTSLTNCRADPIISFRPQGRLGNQMCEYIHLFHAHKTYSIEARVHPKMWKSLHISFPKLTLEPITENCFNELSSHELEYKAAVAAMDTGKVFSGMLTGTPCQPYRWWALRDQWRKELQFSEALQHSTARRESNLRKEWWRSRRIFPTQTTVTVVGVHVRRGDYILVLEKYSGNDLLQSAYYHNAFQYFRTRWERPVFLILTEPSQRSWCHRHLRRGTDDVIVVDDGASAEQDLALLASMKHIVYSHGTFGLMAILLSDVQTIVYPGDHNDPTKKRYSHHRNLDKLSKNLTNVNFVTVPMH